MKSLWPCVSVNRWAYRATKDLLRSRVDDQKPARVGFWYEILLRQKISHRFSGGRRPPLPGNARRGNLTYAESSEGASRATGPDLAEKAARIRGTIVAVDAAGLKEARDVLSAFLSMSSYRVRGA